MTARLSVTAVRFADADDLLALRDIEAAADAQFASVMDPSDWSAATDGQDRAALPGFLLVVGSPVAGFAHVTELVGGRLHLEQVAVHPRAQRQGVGTMLLHAVVGLAREAGANQLTLMTYADVAWNAPWYAREGFVELTEALDPQTYAALAPVRVVERGLGLARGGRRIAMVRTLSAGPPPIPAVSVIPVRQGTSGLEVFVQHRASTMDFVPGAVVFPGGRVDPIDRELARNRRIVPDHIAAEHAAAWQHTAYALLGENGFEAARVIAETGAREVAEETGARLDPTRLIPWDNWMTPETAPKRFDVFFHVLPVEDGAEFGHATREATHSEWVVVEDLVRSVETGAARMVPPTRALVDELAALGSRAAVAAHRPRIVAVTHDVIREVRPRRAAP